MNNVIEVIGELLNDKENVVPYKKNLNRITWWILSSIILQQAIYRSSKSWWKFYKFIDACNHNLYVEWDSWCEELWMTDKEFKTALKKIAFKRWKTKNVISKEDAFIIYYTDSNNMTRYEVNIQKVAEVLTDKHYNRKEILKMSSKTCSRKLIAQSAITKEDTNQQLPNRCWISNCLYTENTQRLQQIEYTSFESNDAMTSFFSDDNSFLDNFNLVTNSIEVDFDFLNDITTHKQKFELMKKRYWIEREDINKRFEFKKSMNKIIVLYEIASILKWDKFWIWKREINIIDEIMNNWKEKDITDYILCYEDWKPEDFKRDIEEIYMYYKQDEQRK